MKRTAFISLLGTSFAGAVAADELQPAPAAPAPAPRAPRTFGDVADPRSGPSLTIFYKNQKDSNATLNNALMVFARHDLQPPNQILGVKGTFTDEQIAVALKKFYHEWRPVPCQTVPRPKLILAAQNWGCGYGLYEPLKKLSEEFEIDVYLLYPVITAFASSPGYPGHNDKRLGEILNGR
jgi:hypothetical protein